ncbi:hypothetical protein NUU61_009099 [Penicillium alfredii]|uniref:Uncharacterized protein n=1 Tax=Penicillium alfredii TaxID=1506179 RepID=A0A9W9EMK9_9EURO|nr:uncharacterized protein NUU61_009099 [Penicillium alfredii]KAJ5084520.1 hypothetical protein NUU61_009099 [Penicillium alfredii]
MCWRKKALKILEPHLMRMENKLQKRGYWNLVQMLRLWQVFLHFSESPEDFGLWEQTVVELDIHLCEVVQQEAFLKDEYQKLEKTLVSLPPRKDELDERQEELKQLSKDLSLLNQEYWSTDRKIYANDLRCPDPIINRAYRDFRQDPQWIVQEGEAVAPVSVDVVGSHEALIGLEVMATVLNSVVAVSRLVDLF